MTVLVISFIAKQNTALIIQRRNQVSEFVLSGRRLHMCCKDLPKFVVTPSPSGITTRLWIAKALAMLVCDIFVQKRSGKNIL